MSDKDILSGLIELSQPGAWIAEHQRIWQMNFLTASKLGSFGSKRGLASFSEKDIIQFWQLGLIKADFIVSRRKLSLVGVVYRSTDKYGCHIYSDERNFPKQRKNWKNAHTNLKPLQKGVDLFFHPFRYYILYHIDKRFNLGISKVQMLSQTNFSHFIDWYLSSFNYWIGSEHFAAQIRKWNNIASLCILSEPCTYQRIFHAIRYDPSDVTNQWDGSEEIRNHIIDYWEQYVKDLYQRIGIEQLEVIRQDLCFDTQMLDPNEWIHTLLCLGDSDLRMELEGNLGGALVLRTMAEMLRRAAEEVFHTQLREEDELGVGQMHKDAKKALYGSHRILDDQQAGAAFARRHGLNYKPRVHIYGEGNTECGALNSFFKQMGILVPITNLHGLIKHGKSMVTFFRDSLRSDIKEQVYSLVIIDDDVPANLKIMESAAKNNQASPNDGIFGRFFLSHQDLEFGNFEIGELEEILWRWVGGENPTQAERELLHSYVERTPGSTEFFNGVKKASIDIPRLTGFDKSEEWGEELMKFAWEYPLKQNKQRPLIEAIYLALHWEETIAMEPYEISLQSYMIHPQTGEIIKRSSSSSS